jgi:hypothetical protein
LFSAYNQQKKKTSIIKKVGKKIKDNRSKKSKKQARKMRIHNKLIG